MPAQNDGCIYELVCFVLKIIGFLFFQLPYIFWKQIIIVIRRNLFLARIIIILISTFFVYNLTVLFFDSFQKYSFLPYFFEFLRVAWFKKSIPQLYLCWFVGLSPFFIIKGILDTSSATQEKKELREYVTYTIGRNAILNRTQEVTDMARTEHTLILGSTGCGKTTSALLPAIKNDIEKGKGLLIIDCKAEKKFKDMVYTIAKNTGREKDFLYFSLSEPDLSNSYSPLVNGDAISLRDMCLASFSWSESYYFEKSKSTLSHIFTALEGTDTLFTWDDLIEILTEQTAMMKLASLISDEDERTARRLLDYVDKWRVFQKETSGLFSNIEDYTLAKYKKICLDPRPQINLFDAHFSDKIIFFSLDSLRFGETARRIGKMVLQDLKVLAGFLNDNPVNRKFFPVYLDEFHHLVFDGFVTLIGQCRSAEVGLHLSTQTLSDLAEIRDQVIENTNIKIVMRQNQPESAETIARMAGTRTTEKMTKQTKEDDSLFFGKGTEETGMGTAREVEEYIVHPNRIKRLNTGEAVYIRKGQAEILVLDYIDMNQTSNFIPNLDYKVDKSIAENLRYDREELRLHTDCREETPLPKPEDEGDIFKAQRSL